MSVSQSAALSRQKWLQYLVHKRSNCLRAFQNSIEKRRNSISVGNRTPAIPDVDSAALTFNEIKSVYSIVGKVIMILIRGIMLNISSLA